MQHQHLATVGRSIRVRMDSKRGIAVLRDDLRVGDVGGGADLVPGHGGAPNGDFHPEVAGIPEGSSACLVETDAESPLGERCANGGGGALLVAGRRSIV